VRETFTVEDFHLMLLAGLPAHSKQFYLDLLGWAWSCLGGFGRRSEVVTSHELLRLRGATAPIPPDGVTS